MKTLTLTCIYANVEGQMSFADETVGIAARWIEAPREQARMHAHEQAWNAIDPAAGESIEQMVSTMSDENKRAAFDEIYNKLKPAGDAESEKRGKVTFTPGHNILVEDGGVVAQRGTVTVEIYDGDGWLSYQPFNAGCSDAVFKLDLIPKEPNHEGHKWVAILMKEEPEDTFRFMTVDILYREEVKGLLPVNSHRWQEAKAELAFIPILEKIFRVIGERHWRVCNMGGGKHCVEVVAHDPFNPHLDDDDTPPVIDERA